MAAKLTQTATIHKLAPRKAKGAGGQKRKGPSTTRLKPAAGTSKPAAPRKSSQPSDAEIRQNTQNRLVALHTQHRATEHKMTAASEVLSDLRTKKQEIRAAIQNTCVPLAIYDELHKKVTAKTKRADNELYEKQRAMAFEAFALPCGPTAELDFKGVPEASRPALYWEEMGYHVAIDGAGQFADPQRDGVPPENVQDYMKGHQRGTARIGEGFKSLKKDEAKPKTDAAPLMVGEDPQKAAAKLATRVAVAAVEYARVAIAKGETPNWNGFPDDPDAWTDAQTAVFKDWYDGLDPEADIDIAHEGAAAMFDRLDAPPEDEAVGEEIAPGDDFETSPEELQGQTTRRVIQEQAAHAEPQFSDD